MGKIFLSNYFKAQNLYLEPVENAVGFDHEKGKTDSVQYITILPTFKPQLQHEDVLVHVFEIHSLETDPMAEIIV